MDRRTFLNKGLATGAVVAGIGSQGLAAAEKKITILVSTPYMDEASLCDRVALIQKGKIMQIETPENVINNFEKQLLSVRSDHIYGLLKSLRKYNKTNSVFPFGQFLHFTSVENKTDLDVLRWYLRNEGHQNVQIEQIKPNIEDCFMALMS